MSFLSDLLNIFEFEEKALPFWLIGKPTLFFFNNSVNEVAVK